MFLVQERNTVARQHGRRRTHGLHLDVLRLLVVALPREDGLAVLVKLELGDDDVRGGDTDGDRRAVALVARDALDKDAEVLALAGGNATLAALVGATDDLWVCGAVSSVSAGPRIARSPEERTLTSSSRRMGIERVCETAHKGQPVGSMHTDSIPHPTHAVLRTQLLRERGRHDDPADRGRRREVGLVRLALRDGDNCGGRIASMSCKAYRAAGGGGAEGSSARCPRIRVDALRSGRVHDSGSQAA